DHPAPRDRGDGRAGARDHDRRPRRDQGGVPCIDAARGPPGSPDRTARASGARPADERRGRRRGGPDPHVARPMNVVTVIGNRPQFVKAAAVSRLLRDRHGELLVHTGQHHDDELSTIFVRELGVPRPEVELGIHGGTNTDQTARMLAALGPLLAERRPDRVLVYGDTNSTFAGALAAAQANIPVAHVEAGMRSFDRAMPEEVNRVLTDHASDLLLCPSQTAVDNLCRESVAGEVVLVGDVMVDVAHLFQPRARDEDPAFHPPYVLATAH